MNRTTTSSESSAEQLRVVFDTNIYIAAILNPGKYADEWLRGAGSAHFGLFVSEDILKELERKLREKKLTGAAEYLGEIRDLARIVTPTERLNVVSDEPDNRILECAVEARAGLIVTMDKHLLRLKQFRSIGITHPRDLKYLFPK